MGARETELERVERAYQRRYPDRSISEEALLALVLAALTERMRVWEQGARDWRPLREQPLPWVLLGLALAPSLRDRPWLRRLWELARAGSVRVAYAPMLPLFSHKDDDSDNPPAYVRFVALQELDERHGLTRKALALLDRHRRGKDDPWIAALREALVRPEATNADVRLFAQQWREMVGAGLARGHGHPPDEPRLAFFDGVHLKCIASGYEPPTHRDIRELALWCGVERMSPDACRVWVRDKATWSKATWASFSSWQATEGMDKP
jgi:hypothetical protein